MKPDKPALPLSKSAGNEVKKQYRAPQLMLFGSLAGITAGGSFGKTELHPWQTQKQRP